MNDEIKELIRDCNELLNDEFFTLNNIEITRHELNLLLDYITNLQQELEEYKDTETYSKRFLYKANKDRLNANLDLVKENERLKEQVKREVEVRDYEVSLKIDYKSRIEKAVEYIENTPLYETTYDYNMEEELEIQNVSDETASNKLLNILNGRSDE